MLVRERMFGKWGQLTPSSVKLLWIAQLRKEARGRQQHIIFILELSQILQNKFKPVKLSLQIKLHHSFHSDRWRDQPTSFMSIFITSVFTNDSFLTVILAKITGILETAFTFSSIYIRITAISVDSSLGSVPEFLGSWKVLRFIGSNKQSACIFYLHTLVKHQILKYCNIQMLS